MCNHYFSGFLRSPLRRKSVLSEKENQIWTDAFSILKSQQVTVCRTEPFPAR